MLLLTEFQGNASAMLDAEPGDVFTALTQTDRLPQWNKRIEKILQPPGYGSGPWCRLTGEPESTSRGAVHPKTFWRRVILVHIRRRQLRTEMQDSLDLLATSLVTTAH